MSGGNRNILRLGIKELKSLRTDPVLLLLIVYVFTYAVYAVATGVKFEVENASVGIVDEDRSSLSRSIAQAILPPYFKPPVPIRADEVAPALDRGRFAFVLQIGPNFEADTLAGRNPEIQLDVDATAMALAGNGATDLQNIVADEIATYLRRSQADARPPINLIVHSKFNPNLRSAWFTSVMQVINNITILSIVLTGAALIRERERGTVEHLLAMPVTPFQIMMAKIWANGLVIIVAAILSLWLVVQGFLHVPIAGSVLLFIAGAVLYQFSVTALGLLIASFTNSMPQFGLLVMPVLIVIYLLSGSTTPMESMPVWLQDVMQLSSSTHFVAFAQAILYRGAGISFVWRDLIALAGLGAIYFSVSLLRFRRALAS